MSKQRRSKLRKGLQRGHVPKRAPPVFSPLVMGVPNEDFSFTEDQFTQLEEVALFKFSVEQRLALTALAQSWIYDLQARRTARPKQFRSILDKLEQSLSQAREVCR